MLTCFSRNYYSLVFTMTLFKFVSIITKCLNFRVFRNGFLFFMTSFSIFFRCHVHILLSQCTKWTVVWITVFDCRHDSIFLFTTALTLAIAPNPPSHAVDARFNL
jgi:hypothetical protein